MKLHEIKPAQGATRAQMRVGRGTGSGHGNTSTRGHKGQWARSGGGVRPGFEGGQLPLIRRIPKRGFHNKWGKVYSIVNIAELEGFDNGTVVTPELLVSTGIVRKLEKDGVKILGNGDFTKSLTVQAAGFTSAAKEKIEANGGKAEVIG